MFKEKLENEITYQRKVGRIHKLIGTPFSSSGSESPSENGFLENGSESNDNSGSFINTPSSSPV